MKNRELIERLMKLPMEDEVMILDGFNGGGSMRTINLGPVTDTITAEDVNEGGADLDGKENKKVIVMGYGCY